MPRTRCTIVLLGAILFAPQEAHAQGGGGASLPPRPDSAAVLRSRAALTSDLRSFASGQDTFFKEYGHFARSVRDLVELKKFAASPGVTIVLLTSTDAGYSAIAIAAEAAELVCAIWLGSSPPPLGASDEGRVQCRVPAGAAQVP